MPVSLKTATLKVRDTVSDEWNSVSVKTNSENAVNLIASSIAIVANGDQCAAGAAQGQYVILKNSAVSGCDDGLYTATQAISANTSIDATYLAAVNNGGLNDLKRLLDTVHPVGSIYMSASSTDPGSLFGGTWERIQDRFLLAAGSSYSAGSTGGSATHTLAVGNLPSHNHSIGAHSHGLNGHTHSVGAHSHGLNGHTHSIPKLSGTAASNGAHTHSLSKQVMKYLNSMREGTHWCRVMTQNPFTSSSVTATSNGAHTHSVTTTANTSGGNSGSTANSSAFNTGGNSGNTANSSAFNSGNTGSGTAVNHMPPYLAVYVWKRTA